jgi:hypothetical protein
MVKTAYRIGLGIIISACAPRRCRTGGDTVPKQMVIVCFESTAITTAITGVLLSRNVMLTLKPLCATIEGCLVVWI